MRAAICSDYLFKAAVCQNLPDRSEFLIPLAVMSGAAGLFAISFFTATMGKKGSLKSALNSQQSRLKKKQDAAQAAKVAEQKGKKPGLAKGKGKASSLPSRATVPFKPTDVILLIGEGNFSFARALLHNPPPSLQHLPPSNVIATAYDSEEECYMKYPEAEGIVQELRATGAEVLFNVDATKLEKCAPLRNKQFDKIVWNFPHAGEKPLATVELRRALISLVCF